MVHFETPPRLPLLHLPPTHPPTHRLLLSQVFTAPALPRDYRPVHHFRPVVDLSKVSPIVAAALQASRGQMVPEPTGPTGRHTMDSGKRATLLGEQTLQGKGEPAGQDVMSLPPPSTCSPRHNQAFDVGGGT